MLTRTEREVLVPLLQQPHVAKAPTPLILETLRDRGYVRLAANCVDGKRVGGIVAVLTTAGRLALEGESK